MGMLKKKYIWFFVAATVTSLLFGVLNYFLPSQTLPPPEKSPWVETHSPVLGSHQAPITIVQFLDPASPDCRTMQPYINEILQTYPQSIKVVIRYVSQNPSSLQAIRLLEASRQQGLFYETLEKLLAMQPAWVNAALPDDSTWQFLEETNLNTTKALQAAAHPSVNRIISLDQMAAEQAVISQTPTFFIDGIRLETSHPTPLLRLIESQLRQHHTQAN